MVKDSQPWWPRREEVGVGGRGGGIQAKLHCSGFRATLQEGMSIQFLYLRLLSCPITSVAGGFLPSIH